VRRLLSSSRSTKDKRGPRLPSLNSQVSPQTCVSKPSWRLARSHPAWPYTLSDQPVAITGQIGYAIPARNFTMTFASDPDTGAPTIDTELNPRVLIRGVSIRYSMPYLKLSVVDLGLREFINHLILLVEANLQSLVANTLTSGKVTTGTISPSTIWVGNTFQFDIEALIPINRPSGSNVGVIAQLHLYLDEIGPRGIGKPLFGGPVQPASPFRG
jgi:hypothetical protein